MGFPLNKKNKDGRHAPAWVIGEGVVERRHDEPVHFATDELHLCRACGFAGVMVWTDDAELYNRHSMRCNYIFVAEEV